MRHYDDGNDNGSARTSLLVFGFVLMILLYLVAIDRPSWFHIRPFSGSAMAMSNAAEPAPESRPATTAAAATAAATR